MKKILLLSLSLLLLLPAAAQANSGARIVGGQVANAKEWPHTVSLVFRIDNRGKAIRSAYWGHYCTGTLLTKRIVITARHCDISATSTDVVIGRKDLTQAGRGERIPVMWTEIVNDVDMNNDGRVDMGGDIALMKLVRPSKQGKPLGLGRLGSPSMTGDMKAAGWGLTETERPTKLRSASFPRVADSECQQSYPIPKYGEDIFHFVPGSQICAGAPGKDTCMGDSGGPLMQNGRLVGITSFGEYYCGQGDPGVYARVDRVKRWIKNTLRFLGTVHLYRKKKPIVEKAGWQPRRYVEWGVVDGQDLTSLDTSSVILRSNRYIRNATIEIVGDSVLCPGDFLNYRFNNQPAQPDERCSQTLPMTPSPGGEEVSWSGWNPDPLGKCPLITMRATIGGQPFQASYYSCEAPDLIKRSFS